MTDLPFYCGEMQEFKSLMAFNSERAPLLEPALVGPAPVVADSAQAIAFFKQLFPVRDGKSVVHFRGVPEPKDARTPKNLHYALDEQFDSNVAGFLEWCAVDGRAAFFLPGCVRGTGTGKADVVSLPAVLVDLDKGNPDENLKAVEALIGVATITVESGGKTDSGPKLHAYWGLTNPATLSELNVACAAREELAKRFGGDTAFKQPAQVIRIPGSIHFKGTPKLVKLRSVSNARYELKRIAEKLYLLDKPSSEKTNVINFLDYSGVDVRQADVERALSAPVHEGGVDDLTRFEAAGKAIGHFIRMAREGRSDLDGAWTATKDWNAATLVPPWDEDRLRTDFERLVRADVQARGPIVASAPIMAASVSSDWSIDEWSIDRFTAPAPARRWLVEDLLPAGTAGVFAAAGDAGKSMMALWLAYVVGCYPPLDPNAALDLSAPRFFGQPIVRRGAAVVLTAEDDADEVHRRIEKLDSAGLRKRGKQRVFVVPMPSAGGVRSIMEETTLGARPTQFWQTLQAKLANIPDLALVVIDPLSAFVDADVERDNRTGAALMTMLSEFATRTGATVILTHHVTKDAAPTGLRDARSAIRGAGALVNNGRFALAMWEADPDRADKVLSALGQKDRAKQAGVVFLGGLAKGNAPGTKVLRTMARNAATGLLEDVTDAVRAGSPRQGEDDDAVYAALRARKLNEARFDFTKSKNPLEEAWKTALQGAGRKISREQREEQFWRLVGRGLIVETAQQRGGHPVYEPTI
jgi:hypothetical protein